jgi:hypothetical protein
VAIAIGKNQAVFAVLETNTDETYHLFSSATATSVIRMASPAAAVEAKTNFLLTAGEGQINQQLELLPDEQLRSGRSRRASITGRYNPGTFTLPVYLKTGGQSASGSFINCPEMDVLLQSAFGTRESYGTTTATAASCTYSLNNRNPSFTLWVRKDHTVFCGVGATCNRVRFEISGSAIGMATFEGEFMGMLRGGTTYLAVGIATASAVDATYVEVPHGASDQFDIGMTIQIGSGSGTANTNLKAGYKITNIVRGATGSATDLIYFATATNLSLADPLASGSAGAVIKGYIPFSDDASQVERGTPLHGKRGLLTMLSNDGADHQEELFILSASIEVNSNIKYSVDEKNGTFYPKDYFTSDFREVTGNLKLYFRESNAKFYADAFSRKTYQMVLPCGDQDFHTIKLNLPAVEVETPSVSGANEMELDVNIRGIMDSVVDDEITLTME